MKELSTGEAKTLSDAFSTISEDWYRRQSKTRYLTQTDDNLEKLVDSGLLREAVAKHLQECPLGKEPTVLFMDRHGGGDGAKVSSALIELIGSMYRASYIHVAFNTPALGVGTLLRSTLSRKGADCGVLVDVVSLKRPAEGLELSSPRVTSLLHNYALVVTYAPQGAAGFIPFDRNVDDSLIGASHINVLSWPDPESLVADIQTYENVISSRPGFNHIRFWVQVLENNGFKTIGHCNLGEGGDARQRLWVLLDNAKRHVYRVLGEPIARNEPIGDPLLYPCRTLLEKGTGLDIAINRIVSAGSNLMVVAAGRACKRSLSQ